MNGLGFAALLILCALAIWAAYAPAKKKPAVAAAGQDNQIGDPMSEIQATTLMAGAR